MQHSGSLTITTMTPTQKHLTATSIKLMMISNPGVKQQLFIDDQKNSQPIELTNLTMGNLGIALNNAFKGSTIEDGTNSANFKPPENSIVSIADINSVESICQ